MNVRADANQRFLLRFLIIGLFCFAGMLWFLYDGFIGYPKELVRAKAYKELEVETPEIQSEKWYAMAAAKGWNNEIPESPSHVEQDIVVQFVMAGLFGLAGAGFLFWYLRSKSTWIEMDEKGIHSSWGARIEFDEIQSMNKRRWDKKGIAKLIGNENVFVLDDFKYDRPSVDTIIREVESRLNRDQIQHGQTEAEKDLAKKEKQAKAEALSELPESSESSDT